MQLFLLLFFCSSFRASIDMLCHVSGSEAKFGYLATFASSTTQGLKTKSQTTNSCSGCAHERFQNSTLCLKCQWLVWLGSSSWCGSTPTKMELWVGIIRYRELWLGLSGTATMSSTAVTFLPFSVSLFICLCVYPVPLCLLAGWVVLPVRCLCFSLKASIEVSKGAGRRFACTVVFRVVGTILSNI